MSSHENGGTVRVLLQTLRLRRPSDAVQIDELAEASRTTESFARAVLTQILGRENYEGFPLDSKARVQVAFELARMGSLKDAARALTWQEFEKFGAECLIEAGFRTRRNVRVKGDRRAWQIDLVGYRGELMLTIDCKHWITSGHKSRLALPAEHQRISTIHLLRTLTEKEDGRGKKLQGVAVILTLLDPPSRFLEGVALISVEQFPGFLSAVTPYDDSLPLISTFDLVAESPMS